MGLTQPPTFILVFHVIMGSLSILSGAGALLFKKGSRPHVLSGRVFVIVMILMTMTGMVLSIMKPVTLSVIASGLTFYLVVTSWAAIKRPENQIGRFEVSACLTVFITAFVSIVWGLDARVNPIVVNGYTVPYQAYLIFGAIGINAGLWDFNVILKRGVAGAHRIARHLWRMCLAFFIASASIFQGNPQVFPEHLRDSLWLAIPTLLILVLLFFWLIRVRFTRWYDKG